MAERRESEQYKGNRTWQEAYENPDEVYSAKEIFDLIQYNEFKKVKDPEKLKKELLENEMKEEDIDLAFKLMVCVGAVDQTAFWDGAIPLEFIHSKSKQNEDFFAGYDSPDKNPSESYVVFVEGFHEAMKKNLARKMVLVGEDGKFIKDAPLPTEEEFFLGVAIHEVRHRLQRQEGFKLFSAKDIPNLKNPLKKIAIYIRELKKASVEVEQEGKNRESVIAYYEDPIEFDSSFVEYLARHRIHHGIALREFFDLVKVQPEYKK